MKSNVKRLGTITHHSRALNYTFKTYKRFSLYTHFLSLKLATYFIITFLDDCTYSSFSFLLSIRTGTVHTDEATGTASLTDIVKAGASMTGGRVPNGVTVTSTGTVTLL
jgi:hypothetical protein